MFAIDGRPAAYFFDPNSIRVFGERVAYTTRYPVGSSSSASREQRRGIYQEDTDVLDCKKSVFGVAETTLYNAAGEITSHFKTGDPETLDLTSVGQPFFEGSIFSIAKRMLCDEKQLDLVRAKKRLDAVHLSFLATTSDGSGTAFHGPIEPRSDPAYPVEALFVDKKNIDVTFPELIPEKNTDGKPPSRREPWGNFSSTCIGAANADA
jgi:hypothetical protein